MYNGAMKGMLTWLGLTLPWSAGAIALCVFCYQSYMDGFAFTKGMHFFGWLVRLFGEILVCLLALMVSVVVLLRERRSLRERGRFGLEVGLIVSSLILPLLTWPAVSGSFNAGRDAGYRSLDYDGIYQACMRLRESIPADKADLVYSDGEGNHLDLPTALQRLHPMFVHVTHKAAAVQLDGGGVMYHEGIGMVFPGGRCAWPEDLRRLHPSLPVYMYRLYDSWVFLNSVQDESSDKPNSGG